MIPFIADFVPVLPEPKPMRVEPFLWTPEMALDRGIAFHSSHRQQELSRNGEGSYVYTGYRRNGSPFFASFDEGALQLFHSAKWYANSSNPKATPYLKTTVFISGEETLRRFHNLLLLDVMPDGWMIDHIERDRLDNRFSNLRMVTPLFNSLNRENQAKYWGVHKNNSKRDSFSFTFQIHKLRITLPSVPLFGWAGVISNAMYYSIYGIIPGEDGTRGDLAPIHEVEYYDFLQYMTGLLESIENDIRFNLLSGFVAQLKNPTTRNAGREYYLRAVELAEMGNVKPSDFQPTEELASELVRAEAALAVA